MPQSLRWGIIDFQTRTNHALNNKISYGNVNLITFSNKTRQELEAYNKNEKNHISLIVTPLFYRSNSISSFLKVTFFHYISEGKEEKKKNSLNVTMDNTR